MENDANRGKWKILWEQQFEELEVWLIDKGFNLEVAHDVENYVVLENKIVCIRSRSPIEYRYYNLLHECGHILVSQDSKQWKKDMPMYAQDPKVIRDGRRERGNLYKVSTIAEEIEAWKRGRRLAKKMEHHIDNKKYNKLMADCVFTYVEWAAANP